MPLFVDGVENDKVWNSCAACDCPLGDDSRTVTLDGQAVEVCCQECAIALHEADVAIARQERRADGSKNTPV